MGPASSGLHRNNASPEQAARSLTKRQMLERRDPLQKVRGVAPGLLSPCKEISYQSCCFVLACKEMVLLLNAKAGSCCQLLTDH